MITRDERGNRLWVPSPKQIEKGCRTIREQWDQKTREARSIWLVESRKVVMPTVNTTPHSRIKRDATGERL